MNEIFVEEENTVYELDPECLKRKEEQKKMEETKPCKMQKQSRNQQNNLIWILCLCILCIR